MVPVFWDTRLIDNLENGEKITGSCFLEFWRLSVAPETKVFVKMQPKVGL